jgi:hypothetical protein
LFLILYIRAQANGHVVAVLPKRRALHRVPARLSAVVLELAERGFRQNAPSRHSHDLFQVPTSVVGFLNLESHYMNSNWHDWSSPLLF